MTTQTKEWTTPYCGVSHLKTEKFLCTVVDWVDFAEATIYRNPVRIADGRDKVFYKIKKSEDPVEEAKKWCEQEIAD